ncbi:hypothetical protein LCGC14_0897410 [marine sediment metagenome]|uniref:Uncharacterized protein n=1 Tax=marine sediment metagenome TaxID=412755 RepID=A0A0F9NXD5_9ZZZZ
MKTKETGRDTQREKAYAWEKVVLSRLPTNKQMPTAEIQKLAHRVVLTYRMPSLIQVERVTHTRGHAIAHYAIQLPDFAHTKVYALHELAHSIQSLYQGRWSTMAGHGPEWLRTFIELLNRYKVAPKRELLRSARRNGLKVASPKAMPAGPRPHSNRAYEL